MTLIYVIKANRGTVIQNYQTWIKNKGEKNAQEFLVTNVHENFTTQENLRQVES